MKLVDEMDLELHYVDMNRSGIYLGSKKTIFLSKKLLERNSDFELSHELGHCIERHEELSAYYQATATSRRKLEFEANAVAIEILLHLWFSQHDFDNEYLNPVKFMAAYNIPSFLESTVRKVMSSYK